jgi:hypothetical protein
LLFLTCTKWHCCQNCFWHFVVGQGDGTHTFLWAYRKCGLGPAERRPEGPPKLGRI